MEKRMKTMNEHYFFSGFSGTGSKPLPPKGVGAKKKMYSVHF
jgi:hypothetical protein